MAPKPKLSLLIALFISITNIFAQNDDQKQGNLVEGIVLHKFFDNLIEQSNSDCEGRNFYTRQAFLDALKSYPSFAKYDDNLDSTKREIAAFFAIIAHETGHLCHIDEVDRTNDLFCDEENFPQYPCASEKKYYGRGPLQISWNYNYGPAGKEIGFDGLGSPETVSNDATISFKTALWYWMKEVHPVSEQGFGAVIRAVNGDLECDGQDQSAVFDRANQYLDYCKMFDVAPGDHVTC